jgi:hypothetical protein
MHYKNQDVVYHWNSESYTCPRYYFDEFLINYVKQTSTTAFHFNVLPEKYVTTDAGIEIHFYSPGTDLNNLPLAFAIEDYSGSQAYVGYAPKYLTSPKIKANTWNSFILPLKDFPFTATQTDPGNTKQFIIQFEADGNIIFDKIKIVSLIKK